ncbi:probable E3 SUMO-protein ligase RNF212 [Oncorhynchus clarkii lewisi]|uniref:probable E3 SUMO-protein ligase RNF212 n=1 Tax=Oncorhynchus clarkii lewisi TaxID=490388 RepID=UPI0039B8218C
MPYWICCNSCFNLPGPDCQLAVASCGHVICSVCFQKGKQGEYMICKAKCQVTPLSDKSSAEVKALFSDINSVATKHFTEISKVLLFQARHQKRLMVHYQKRNEKLELKMKQEIQQMSKKITAQNAYIAKLESTLQHQRCTIESILSDYITTWYGNCTAHNRKALQRVVRSAQRITGGNLPTLQDTYSTGCHRKAKISSRTTTT